MLVNRECFSYCRDRHAHTNAIANPHCCRIIYTGTLEWLLVL